MWAGSHLKATNSGAQDWNNGPAGCWAPRHDAVRTGGLRGENEERCKLVPEKESKWRFWMCKVHQLRSHFPSSSSPIGREVGEELATPLP